MQPEEHHDPIATICPRCGAKAGQPCRTTGGNLARSYHVARQAALDALLAVRTGAQLPLRAEERWSPSRIGLASRHCPAALDYRESGIPVPRDHFTIGTAAHQVLQDVTDQTIDAILTGEQVGEIVATTIDRLVAVGRIHDGAAEGPLSADRVAEGARIARAWLAEAPIMPGTRAEVRMAVRRDWTPCEWDDPAAWLRGIADAVTPPIFDLGGDGDYRHLVEYKTSWAAGREDLGSVQVAALTCLLDACGGEAGERLIDEVGMQAHLVSLRVRKTWVERIDPGTMGRQIVDGLRRTVEAVIAGLSRRPGLGDQVGPGGRLKSIGRGCLTCPYVVSCNPGSWASPPDQAQAVIYLGFRAMVNEAESVLRQATSDAPMPLPDGSEVGYRCQTGVKAARKAWEALAPFIPPQDLLGAFGVLKLTAPQVRALAQWIAGDDEQRAEELFADATEPDNRRRWGVWPPSEETR